MTFTFEEPAPFFHKPGDNRTRGLKQYTHFAVAKWLRDAADELLLDGQWHEIPTSYKNDPTKGFNSRYRYLLDEGWLLFRYAPRPHKLTGATLHRAEVRYVFGPELDEILDAKYGG